jgi:hypothetical protein
MHKLAEKIADCMKAKVEAKGIDNIEGQDLVELGMWTDIIKDLVCYDKDKKIIEAMDEAEESEEAMKYIEMYEDYPERKGYRGQRRDSRGRYMSNRGRRGYESRMMPEMDWDDMEYQRDMDRNSHNKMYYADGNMSGSSSMGGGQSSNASRGYSDGQYSSRMQRDSREGRSGESRRSYMESKEMHKDNSSEGKQHKMKELEHYMKDLSEDVTEMITEMSPEEKSLLKQKMQILMQKIG